MSFLSKRTVQVCLLLIIMISVAARYPLVEHERYQADSYFIHLLSQSVVDEGYAPWTFHPLSYFGYYPLSYPSGVPVLTGESAVLSGISVEFSVLLGGICLGIMFPLAVFCLAREFLRRSEFVLLATFLAAVGPRFVDTTYWVGSARGFAVVFVTLSLIAFHRGSSTGDKTLTAIGVIFIFGTIASHHMAVLLILFGIAYVISVVSGSYLAGISMIGRRIPVAVFFLVIAGGIVISELYLFPSMLDPLIRFSESSYIFGFDPKVVSISLNVIASYTHQIGLVIIFAALFVPVAFLRHSRTPRVLMLLGAIVVFIPLIGNSLYVSMMLLPFFSIMGGFWFAYAFGKRRKPMVWSIAMSGLLVSSLLLPFASTYYWNSNSYIEGDTVEVDNQVFNDANYMRASLHDCYSLSNSDILSMKLAAITGNRFMRNGVVSAVVGDFSSESLRDNVTGLLERFPNNLYSWLEFENDDLMYAAGRGILSHGIDFLFLNSDASTFAFEHFSVRQNILVVIDNSLHGQMATRYSIVPSDLAQEIETCEWHSPVYGQEDSSLDCYLVYASFDSSAYMLELPL